MNYDLDPDKNKIDLFQIIIILLVFIVMVIIALNFKSFETWNYVS